MLWLCGRNYTYHTSGVFMFSDLPLFLYMSSTQPLTIFFLFRWQWYMITRRNPENTIYQKLRLIIKVNSQYHHDLLHARYALEVDWMSPAETKTYYEFNHHHHHHQVLLVCCMTIAFPWYSPPLCPMLPSLLLRDILRLEYCIGISFYSTSLKIPNGAPYQRISRTEWDKVFRACFFFLQRIDLRFFFFYLTIDFLLFP